MVIVRRVLVTMLLCIGLVYLGLVMYAYAPYGDGTPARQLAAPGDQFVTVDGIDIRYRTWGEPQAGEPAIVLIHGFANSVSTFREIGPLLGENYYVIALDMPGFGLSAKPTQHDYGNASQAAVVEKFIRETGLQQVVIGGHSMGGAHVVHIAINSPEVVGAILFNPGIISTGVPPATQYFVFPFPRLAAKTFADRSFRERFIKSSFVRPEVISDEVMDEVMLAAQTDDYIAGTTQLMSYYVSGNELTMLDQIRVPVLIVWGAEDRLKGPTEAEDLQQLIRGSRLVKIPDAGHYVHEEAPLESAQAVIAADDFWARSR